MNPALVRGAQLLSGAYTILLFRELPPPAILPVAAGAALLLLRRKASRGVGMFILGFVLIWMDSQNAVGQKLDPSLAGNDLTLAFGIDGFPERRSALIRIIVKPLEPSELPARIRLSWFDAADTPEIGECWQLTIRLRRPRGLSNPGTFDYEGWLFRQGIGATGYVRAGHRLGDCAHAGFFSGLRRGIAERLTTLLPADDAGAVMLAITVGARHRISTEQWQRYAVTGTSHLMAISGMHIGLAALGMYLLLWCLLALTRRSGNHRNTAASAALLIAIGYAAISGLAIPAQRAITMLALVVISILTRRCATPGHFLGVACLVVAAASPLEVLSPGFKLSFAAVAILLLLSQRSTRTLRARNSMAERATGFVRDLTVLQLMLLLGLLPLTAVLFHRASWLAPAVNLLVLPVFNLVTVPVALLGLVFDGPLQYIGDCLLLAAWYSVKFILQVVAIAARLPHAELAITELRGFSLVTACLVMLWVLLPVGWPGRRLAWLAAAATILHLPPRPPSDCVDIHALDVGQGLASVVVTNNRAMVFDAGPSFRSGSDTGQLVVLPFLRSVGVPGLDLLIVSHADRDHAGGARSLVEQIDIGAMLSGEMLRQFAPPQYRCRAGQVWHWDGVTFAVLHPGGGNARDGNNASCVLEISAGEHRALLTGDIEARIERRLLRDALLSPVDLVIVPHHGSATSSHAQFVEALRPRVAVASAGFSNRWGMPKQEVVARWQASGSDVYNTATDGALSFRLCADSGLELTARQRVDKRRFWHEH